MNDGKTAWIVPMTKENVIDAAACGERADRQAVEHVPWRQLPPKLLVQTMRLVSVGPEPTLGQFVTLWCFGWHRDLRRLTTSSPAGGAREPVTHGKRGAPPVGCSA